MKSNAKALARGRRLRYRLEVAGLRFLAWLVPQFSRATVQRTGHVIGWLGCHLSPKIRRLALANLDTAFGDTKAPAEKRRIVLRSSQSFAATMLGLFWSPRLNPEVVQRLVEFEPAAIARMHELQARGTGIIFQTLHFGDWELLSHIVGYYGIRLTVVMDNLRNTGIEDIIIPLRAHSGHEIITEHNAAPKLLRTLRRGGNVALLIDLNAPMDRGGVWLNFFGRRVFNNSAVAALALRTGAAIVCCTAFPLPGGRARVVYGPEIEFTPTGNRTDDVRALSQKCLDFCEDLVRRQPEYWLWSYKRWKNAPTNDLTGYPYYTRPVQS